VVAFTSLGDASPSSNPSGPAALRAELLALPEGAGRSWWAADTLVRRHVPHWLAALGAEGPAPAMAQEEPLEDAATTAESMLAARRAELELARHADATAALKQAWSKAWPAAWNLDSSSRWAAARDAAVESAWNASWLAARSALEEGGTLALAELASAEARPGRLAAAALTLCTLAARRAGWLVAWPAAWETTSGAVTRLPLVLGELAGIAHSAAASSTAPVGEALRDLTREDLDRRRKAVVG
jgi:hypothetical protein